MTLHDDLVAAKALISDPARWHKGSYHNAKGDCHCAMGAVLVATEAAGPFDQRVKDCREALQLALPASWRVKPVGLYNDKPTTGHADIMALFDRAIEASK